MENEAIKTRIQKRIRCCFFSLALLIDEHHQNLGKKVFQRHLKEMFIIKSTRSYIKTQLFIKIISMK